MTVLGIDTSSKTASCALYRDGLTVGQISIYTERTQSQVILPYIDRLLAETGVDVSDVDLIAVSNGPGSYTGLRIGVALVKGICQFSGGKKCLGVSTLESIAMECAAAKGVIIPVMKARSDVVYFGAYESDGERLKCLKEDAVAGISELSEYVNHSAVGEIILTGDYSVTVKNTLFSERENIRVAPEHLRLCRASGVIAAALSHIGDADEAENLRVKYLQVTRAEKELKDKLSTERDSDKS